MLDPLPLLYSALSPAGARARLSILIFHRVLEVPDPLFPEIPDAVFFERQMRWVRRWFNVLPLGEAVARLRSASLPARALAITFDDGYADNAVVAAPILQRLGLTASFFVTTGVLDGGRMWNDTVIEAVRAAPAGDLDLSLVGAGSLRIDDAASRRRAIDSLLGRLKRLPYAERAAAVEQVAKRVGRPLPTGLMMTSAQVRELAGRGMLIGGHTVTHPILTRLDDAAAEAEIADGRDRLAQITGGRVELFAYPNGVPGVDYDARHVAMARRCGFGAAVSTAAGAARPGDDVFQLPRFTPWGRSVTRYGLQLTRNLQRREIRIVQAH